MPNNKYNPAQFHCIGHLANKYRDSRGHVDWEAVVDELPYEEGEGNPTPKFARACHIAWKSQCARERKKEAETSTKNILSTQGHKDVLRVFLEDLRDGERQNVLQDQDYDGSRPAPHRNCPRQQHQR
jgi:hypothetical protein